MESVLSQVKIKINKIDIAEYPIQSYYKFLVIASDGVWELMRNEEVAKYVFKYYEKNDPEAAVNLVMQEAYTRWTKTESEVDDITCVVVFFG